MRRFADLGQDIVRRGFDRSGRTRVLGLDEGASGGTLGSSVLSSMRRIESVVDGREGVVEMVEGE